MTLPAARATPRPRAPRHGGEPPLPPRIAIGAGKGGVGTSTVAALLACTVAALGRRVLLVDAAPHFGGLGALLDTQPPHALSDLRGGALQPRDLAHPVTASLALINAGRGALAETEYQLLLRRLEDAMPGYDLVLIDAGASAASLRSAVRLGATRVLAVTAQDRIALTATYAVVKLLHEQAPDLRVDIVANRVDDAAAMQLHESLNAASVQFLARTTPFAGAIPDDPAFGRAVAGLGVDEAALGSPAAQVARDLGAQLLASGGSPPFLRLLRHG